MHGSRRRRTSARRSTSLVAGLADGAGDRDDLAVRARARGAAEIAQAPPADRRRPAAARRSAKLARSVAATTASAAPAVERGLDEVVAVASSPWIATKTSPGTRVRVSMETPGDASGRQRRRSRPRARPRRSPRWSTARLMRPPRCERRRDLLVVGERQHLVADDLAGLVALAGDEQHVAGSQRRRRRRGSPRRGRRSRSRPARRRGSGADRGRILGARIVVGDDDAVGVLGRDAPISGRLPVSRSPPAPKTTMSRPLAYGRSASAPWRAHRACGHSRRRRRAVRAADELEPALGALQVLAAPRARAPARRRSRSRAPRRPARSTPGTRRRAAADIVVAARRARSTGAARSRRSRRRRASGRRRRTPTVMILRPRCFGGLDRPAPARIVGVDHRRAARRDSLSNRRSLAAR